MEIYAKKCKLLRYYCGFTNNGSLFHRVTQQLTHHTNQSQHINQALPGVPETSSSAYSSFVVAQKHCNRGVEDSGVVLSPSLSRTETVGRSMPLTTVTRQEESFVNVATIQSQSTRMCSLSCQCRCHRKREYTGGAWAKSLLGSWLVRYESLGNTCQGRCAPNPGVKLEYQLPKWLWAGLVSVEMCQNPTFNLALRPCRVLQSNHDIYYMIDHPSILQEHIREGYRYFPDDKNESGDTLLEVYTLHIVLCRHVKLNRQKCSAQYIIAVGRPSESCWDCGRAY